MKTGTIIGLLAAVLVVIGGWYIFRPTLPIVTENPDQNTEASLQTYATTTFRVSFPSDYTVNASYSNDIAPGRRSVGVAFMVPTDMTEGTNLSSDSYISVESIPELSSCHAAQYIMENPVSGGPNITDNGIEYSFATSTGAGAGNIYEETVYVRQDTGPCIAVRYFIHTTQIANYPEGTVREFDRAALLAQFDNIRRSIERQ